jgi:hypothetical protein
MKYSLSAVVPSERLSRVGVFLSLSELFASDYKNLNPTTSIVEISCFKIDDKSASALRILDLEWVLVKVSAKNGLLFCLPGKIARSRNLSDRCVEHARKTATGSTGSRQL